MNKQIWLSLAAVIALIFLSGCGGVKGLNMTYSCPTCDNTIPPGEEANADTAPAKTSQVKSTLYKQHTFSSVVTKDMDVMFLKLKREFGFYTHEDARQMEKRNRATGNYVFDHIPNVYYKLGKWIPNKGEEDKRPETRVSTRVTVLIEKESDKTNKLTVTYQSNFEGQELQNYQAWLEKRFEKALGIRI